jgi:hypothetical protein
MVGIISSFLGPTFISEYLESALIVAAEFTEVKKHF